MKKILQVFNRLFCKKQKKEKIYICNPDRAIGCSKEGCWFIDHGPCRCTKHKEYSKRDEKGKPVMATDMDIWNDEYYDYWISRSLETRKKNKAYNRREGQDVSEN